MAQKRRKKRRWFTTILLFVFTPIIIWILAFLAWFFWRDITEMFDKKGSMRSRPGISRQIEQPQPGRKNESREKIPEEDRRKLDEILKNR